MTLEISPVLAGTYDAPDYVPPHSIASFQSGAALQVAGTSATEDANGVDARLYTKFDRSATEAGSTTDFSFSDLLDTLNPLQHIPVLSSIYREITGDKINPVARVTGDLLYGGLLGGATFMASGIGAIGDAVMEQQNGKDSTGMVMAALFGPDSPSSPAATTLLAQAGTPAAASATAPQANTSALASAQPAAQPSTQPHSFSLAKPAMPLKAMPQFAGMNIPSSGDPKTDAATQALLAAKAFPVDPGKMPFGGVMDPAALQGTNMALALASSAPGAQMGGQVYTGKPFSARSTAPPPAPPIPAPNTQTAASAPPVNTQSAPNYENPIPAALIHDLAAMKAVNQYKSTASQSAPAGANVDVVN